MVVEGKARRHPSETTRGGLGVPRCDRAGAVMLSLPHLERTIEPGRGEGAMDALRAAGQGRAGEVESEVLFAHLVRPTIMGAQGQ